MDLNDPLLKPALWTLGVGSATGLWVVFAYYWSVHPSGSVGPLFLTDLLMVPLVLCVLFTPAAVLCLPFKRTRTSSAQVLVVSFLWLFTTVAGFWVGNAIRMEAIQGVAARGAPLIAAIKAYEQQRGEPPENLDALVPGFLPSVPETGFKPCPLYWYERYPTIAAYRGNAWLLSVNTPTGTLNFDELLYLPTEEYGRFGFESVSPVGAWAYLAE